MNMYQGIIHSLIDSLTHCLIGSLIICLPLAVQAEDGYSLWLRYNRVQDEKVLDVYRQQLRALMIEGNSPTLDVARKELYQGLDGLLGTAVTEVKGIQHDGVILVGTPALSRSIAGLNLSDRLQRVGDEGYVIASMTAFGKKIIVITGNTDRGVLYGVFYFLRLVQMQKPVDHLMIVSSPKTKIRILNHWDNLDRTVERGYAGFSLWDWHKLPGYIDERYHDYARANASIGINGTVLTNVNANALVITPQYLEKVAALANVFRPYGIRVYLTARFSAPIEIGGLATADPTNAEVQAWWKKKVDEIYTYVPDFGGFVVKANSEGQPGPQQYGRTHTDGANMLADALKSHNGIVMWRAFVYSTEVPDDRAKQAYSEFRPLDGKFRDNVIVQVKNGPIDFQPREPFHPLFGAMPKTPLMMEFQITQEYLGQSTNLVYLATLYKECLDTDTYAKGQGSTVARVVDGSLDNHSLSGIAGVANIGTDRNWCGHPFAQANWFAFGRLAWDHALTADQIADEWIRATFSNDERVLGVIKPMMLSSHETVVSYMTPLGLHHIMGYSHHYGPAPWIKDKPRPEWTSVYYHRADSLGVGFDRTATGSNALAQYAAPVAKRFSSLKECPDEFLLWFHHLPWDYKMKSGGSLWDAIVSKYYSGAENVKNMQQQWGTLKDRIDPELHNNVQMLLAIQYEEAVWWRDACVLYFQAVSRRPLAAGLDKPAHTLEYYQKLSFPFAPGINQK